MTGKGDRETSRMRAPQDDASLRSILRRARIYLDAASPGSSHELLSPIGLCLSALDGGHGKRQPNHPPGYRLQFPPNPTVTSRGVTRASDAETRGGLRGSKGRLQLQDHRRPARPRPEITSPSPFRNRGSSLGVPAHHRQKHPPRRPSAPGTPGSAGTGGRGSGTPTGVPRPPLPPARRDSSDHRKVRPRSGTPAEPHPRTGRPPATPPHSNGRLDHAEQRPAGRSRRCLAPASPQARGPGHIPGARGVIADVFALPPGGTAGRRGGVYPGRAQSRGFCGNGHHFPPPGRGFASVTVHPHNGGTASGPPCPREGERDPASSPEAGYRPVRRFGVGRRAPGGDEATFGLGPRAVTCNPAPAGRGRRSTYM